MISCEANTEGKAYIEAKPISKRSYIESGGYIDKNMPELNVFSAI